MKHFIDETTGSIIGYDSKEQQEHIDKLDKKRYKELVSLPADDEEYDKKQKKFVVSVPKVKDHKKEEIKTLYETDLSNGFVCGNGIKMNADFDAILRLKGGFDLAEMLKQDIIDIRDYDNVTHNDVDIDDVKDMILELAMNYQSLWSKKNTLLDVVEKKDNGADVKSIVW